MLVAPVAAVCLLALGAGGSRAHHTAAHSASGGALAALAAVSTPRNAPRYCKTITASAAVRGLGGAMEQLAVNANDASAHATVRQAAATLRASAAQAPAGSRVALITAADALQQLDEHGLGAAGDVNSALQGAGQTLERPCAFPVS